MGIQFRVLRYLPSAVEDWDLEPRERPTPLTTAAVKITFAGKEHWVLLNDMVKLFTDSSVYLLSYSNRRLDMGFPLKLVRFDVERYEGSTQAKEYMSEVEVPGLPIQKISMNEPLKYNGLTIYQASFQEEKGVPVASVFSVNKDPGRFWKYLGSLIMTIGILLLFYFKHLDFKLLKKSKDHSQE
ncbi:Cytochrome c biogenesis protein Ccs1 [compost metagenome]